MKELSVRSSIVMAVLVLWGLFSFLSPASAHRASSAKEREAVETKTVERKGTVDSVAEDSMVINDSDISLDGSVKLYDQYGNSAKADMFAQGDEVTVAFAEDEEAGTEAIVFIKLAKKSSGSGNNASSEQPDTESSQELKKVDGVWTN